MIHILNNINVGIRINMKAKKGLVLLSYLGPVSLILDYFKFKKHPNVDQLRCFVQVLSSQYRFVIYVDYRNSLLRLKSDLIVGFGQFYKNNFLLSKQKFYFATGSSADFVSNEIEKAKLELEINVDSNNNWRYSDKDESKYERISDKILLIGNTITSNSFNIMNQVPVLLLPGNYLKGKFSKPIAPKEVIVDSILWFGSKGILHKGLDIVADVASKLNTKLIVVGVSPDEQNIAHEICKNRSLDYELYGFLKLDSDKWLEILEKVSFALFPSISEGMSTGVLTSVYFGLYPICTDRCGCDVGHVVKFERRSRLVNQFLTELIEIRGINQSIIRDRILLWQREIQSNNSIDLFRHNLLKAFEVENTN